MSSAYRHCLNIYHSRFGPDLDLYHPHKRNQISATCRTHPQLLLFYPHLIKCVGHDEQTTEMAWFLLFAENGTAYTHKLNPTLVTKFHVQKALDNGEYCLLQHLVDDVIENFANIIYNSLRQNLYQSFHLRISIWGTHSESAKKIYFRLFKDLFPQNVHDCLIHIIYVYFNCYF